MIVWPTGERGDLDSITVHTTREGAVAALVDIMNSHGGGWTWVLTSDTATVIEFDGTGPLAELVTIVAIQREVLP